MLTVDIYFADPINLRTQTKPHTETVWIRPPHYNLEPDAHKAVRPTVQQHVPGRARKRGALGATLRTSGA